MNFLFCKREWELLEKVEGREESKVCEGKGWKNCFCWFLLGEFLYKNKFNFIKVVRIRLLY